MEGDFWFSELQLYTMLRPDGRNGIGQLHVNFCELEDDGQIVPYTEMNSSPGGKSNWEDAKYLGRGRYHHMDFIKNHMDLVENMRPKFD